MTSRFPSWASVAAAASWLAPWLALGALTLWVAGAGATALAVAALGVGVRVCVAPRGGRTTAIALALLVAGILVGFAGMRQVERVRSDWEGYWSRRADGVGAQLSEELQGVLEHAETATDALAERAAAEPVTLDAGDLRKLREAHGLAALALYDADGRVVLWDGMHRGKVPEGAQRGLRRYIYRERPLFAYLYVTASVGMGQGTAVGAVLLRTDLPADARRGIRDFGSSFRRRVGEAIRVSTESQAGGPWVWDLKLGDMTLVSVSLIEPAPDVRAAELINRWRLGVATAVLAIWLLLTLAAPPRPAGRVVAAAALVGIAAALPFGGLPRIGSFFDVDLFRLISPLPMSLVRVLAVLLALVAGAGLLPRPLLRLPAWAAGVGVAVLFPVSALWMKSSATEAGLAHGEGAWGIYQAALALLLSMVAGLALMYCRSRGRSGARRSRAAGAVALALALGGALAVAARAMGGMSPWVLAFWGPTVVLAASSLAAWPLWQRAAVTWALSGLIGASAAIPAAWAQRIEARIEHGSERLASLASPSDPALERALTRMSREALAISRQRVTPVDLLYRAWRRSGLGDESYPVRLTLWSPANVPQEELRVGVGPDRPPAAEEGLDEVRRSRVPRILHFDRAEARYVAQVPLPGGRVLTAVVPSAPAHETVSLLSLVFTPRSRVEPDLLSLIPLDGEEPHGRSGLHWMRGGSAWVGELPVAYEDAVYRAHYQVMLPALPLMAARGSLLLMADGLLLFLLWMGGHLVSRQAHVARRGWGGLVVSFRARVTLALFSFFLLAIAIFGSVAYRSISGAAQRAARVLAERVVEDAAGWYFEASGTMELLARRVGVELQEYRNAELREGSVEELVEMGLYEGWIPLGIHRVLDGREAVRAFTVDSLGRWKYVTAYRRLPDGDVLAAEIPLRVGASAIRTRDFLELLGFAIILGAGLSLGLALLVGRALTRPIHTLQLASERVGAGDLTLRLPPGRADEFGSVFEAFNRMVSRLRRARRLQERTTRRTRAIMEEAATGMVALDADGSVIMANPTAEALLGEGVAVGSPLPGQTGQGNRLANWVRSILHDTAGEHDTEIHVGERRVKVRARRIEQSGEPGGWVLSLEDVTDELRTERVLAWGEMARQVAHEVKNPLTPIKLSVQHIRRAWDDQRPDFAKILSRNAEAMLREIDRLAAIAESFSRFAAPGAGEAHPLEPVDLARVVDEVLALYGAGDGPVRFSERVEAGLPLVTARADEVKEVLVNLLENAREALPEGGDVAISASRVGGRVLV